MYVTVNKEDIQFTVKSGRINTIGSSKKKENKINMSYTLGTLTNWHRFKFRYGRKNTNNLLCQLTIY